MGKVFALLVIVVGIWIGMEIMTEGYDDAFGGLLSRGTGGAVEAQEPAGAVTSRSEPLPRYVGRRVEESLQKGASRYDNQLGASDD